LRATFKPEFLNRIDETIIFHNLTPAQIGEIVTIQMALLRRRLGDKNIDLSLDEGALSILADAGYDPIYGARPLKRAIQRHVENPLAMDILKGNVPENSRIRAEGSDGRIVFKVLY
jgi:ATP-dependent Clp protease ATP-binding subunit ClpB